MSYELRVDSLDASSYMDSKEIIWIARWHKKLLLSL